MNFFFFNLNNKQTIRNSKKKTQLDYCDFRLLESLANEENGKKKKKHNCHRRQQLMCAHIIFKGVFFLPEKRNRGKKIKTKKIGNEEKEKRSKILETNKSSEYRV